MLDWGPILPVVFWSWVAIVSYLTIIWLSVGNTHHASALLIRWISGSPLSRPVRCLMVSVTSSFPLINVCAVTCMFVFIEGSDLASIGLGDFSGAAPQIAAGAVAAFVAATVVFVFGIAVRWFRVQLSCWFSGPECDVPRFFGGLAYNITGSAMEEVVLRGYLFALLYRAHGATAAVVGSSLVFALLHILVQKRLPSVYVLNVFLFGVIMAYCRLITESLWAPIGLHVGWNLAMSSVFGFPAHGGANDEGILSTQVVGPEYVTGGLFSPDAGMIGWLGLSAVSAAVVYFVIPLYVV